MTTFQMLTPTEEARRANVAAELASFYAEAAGPKKKEQRFSLARLVNAMNTDDLAGTYEGGVCRAAALAQGRQWSDSRSQIVPWGALMSRDLSVGVPSTAGGNLVGSGVGGAMDALRPFSTSWPAWAFRRSTG